MMNQKDLLQQVKKLRPTATVVRRQDGVIQVERAGLLSAEEERRRVAAAKATPYKRGKVYVYDDGKWSESVMDSTPMFDDNKRSIRVATFNVWFSEHHWKERLRGLVDLLVKKEHSDVICLQEVTPKFLRKLLELDIIRNQYRVSDSGSCSTIGRYGVVMLVAKSLPVPSLGWVNLPTDMGRSALLVHWKKQICLATVHLESLNSQKMRSRQLETIHDELKFFDTAVLAGDFNITASGPWANQEEHVNLLHVMSGFEDLWVREHGSDGDVEGSPNHLLGVTFDTEANKMLAPSKDERSRYDRVVVMEHNARVHAGGIRIVGNAPIGPPDLFISDHFGLVFDLALALTTELPAPTKTISFEETKRAQDF